ncbi:glycosyltransferase, partial [Oharaeibacter diazotrophicus]
MLLGCFWPGNDASGPNQSFRGLATALGDAFDFSVVAASGPPGAAPLVDARADWRDLGFARARYLDDGRFGARGLARLLRETPHDVLCLNSVFDRGYTLPALTLRRLGLIPRRPTLLSPRGEFDDGALAIRSARKRAFLALAGRSGLWSGVTFHATGEAEAAAMRAGLGPNRPIVVAPNVRLPIETRFEPAGDDRLRIAFVGRIVPIKRLDFALEVLAKVRVPVVLDVYGPAEDEAHARACFERAAALPAHVAVRRHGAVDGAAVAAALGRADLFLSPTGGENFGHAIYEALACGVPVVISDRTPWRDLAAATAGWDLSLDRPDDFVAAIERFAAMPPGERARWR